MSENEYKEKLEAFYRLLLSLNAYGSLDLKDLQIMKSYLQGAFGLSFDNSEDCDSTGLEITMPDL